MVSKSQKEARNKWDAKNMKIVACKLRAEKAEAFHAYAKEHGTTANALLSDYIDQCLEEDKNDK